jgi:hypothetical protein
MVEVVASNAETVTVRVPMRFRKQGGRKQVVTPDGAGEWRPPQVRVDNTMVKALARAFRWRKLLETGVYASVGDLAAAELINPSYVSRVLRLTLLAPATVKAILDGRQPAEVTLAKLMQLFPVAWSEQHAAFRR